MHTHLWEEKDLAELYPGPTPELSDSHVGKTRESAMFCSSCGSECSALTKFCEHCGHQINDDLKRQWKVLATIQTPF